MASVADSTSHLAKKVPAAGATGGRGASLPLPLPEELTQLLPHGGYVVEEFLGQGGMGAVYKATQVRLQRPVAIKIMRRHVDVDAGFEERFQREALAMARLNHPNIVNIIDSGEAGPDLLYIVMEFVDGEDLQGVIRSGKMTEALALRLIPQICDAVQFAHEHGIVHRDIKPANVMLTRDGRVKVADFGLAKHLDVDGSYNTQSGASLGTPDYAAPEQFDTAGLVDHRADLYALGVMIYHMLTGQVPRGTWKAPSTNSGVSVQWDDIVSRAMQPEKDDRYASAVDLKADVLRISSGESISPVTPKKPAARASSSKHLLIGLVGSVLVLGVGAFFFFRKSKTVEVPSPSKSNETQTQTATPAAPTLPFPQATKAQPFVNSLGMKFIPVPGTRLLMSIHETRKKDYAAYAADAKGLNNEWKQVMTFNVPIGMTEDHPVVRISWNEAKSFCAWLSARENRNYRLPTDREWSTAVGIAELEPIGVAPVQLSGQFLGLYPWGLQAGYASSDVANFRDRAMAEKFPAITGYTREVSDGWATTAPVMSFKPSVLGFYDLGGNAWEFCEDWYEQTKKQRVLRGGSWTDYPMISTTRAGNLQSVRSESYGFRCVLVPDDLKVPSSTDRALADDCRSVESPQRFGGSRYQLFVGSLRWADAKAKAESIGGHLATISSRIENDWVKSTYGKHLTSPGKSLWLGMYYALPGSEYRWANEEISLFSDWLPGEPNFAKGEGGQAGYPFMLTLSRGDSGPLGWNDSSADPSQVRTSVGFLVEWEDMKGQPLPVASTATPASPLTNSLGMRFVPVPGTNILLCIHETRKSDYKQFAAGLSSLDGGWKAIRVADTPVAPAEECPVTGVSWFEARQFCDWLSRKEGRVYRLPTDREWSCAVGIGEKEARDNAKALDGKVGSLWPWGSVWPPVKGAGNYADSSLKEKTSEFAIIEGYADGFPMLAPAMSFTPNELGIYDLGGNASEWCEDGFGEDRKSHVTRGGSYRDARSILSSERESDWAHYRRSFIGFRCAVEVFEKK